MPAVSNTMNPTTDPQSRRFRLTPGHFLLALLAVEGLLSLSQWFRWLPKGWPVLIAVASVGVMMLAMFVWFGVALIFRRRFQFSLRALLILVVVVALPCSWLAVEMKKAREQKAVVAAIENLSWTISYDWERDAEGKRLNDPEAGSLDPEWLRNLMGEDFFARVIWAQCLIPDNINPGFEHVKDLTDLEELQFCYITLTDQRKWGSLVGMSMNDSTVRQVLLELGDASVGNLRVLKLQIPEIT